MRGLNRYILSGSFSITTLALGIKFHNEASKNNLLIAKESSSSYKLQHVQLVFRHGARTPVSTIDLPGVEPAVWDPEKFSGYHYHTDADCEVKLLNDGKTVSIKDIDPSNFSKELLKVDKIHFAEAFWLTMMLRKISKDNYPHRKQISFQMHLRKNEFIYKSPSF